MVLQNARDLTGLCWELSHRILILEIPGVDVKSQSSTSISNVKYNDVSFVASRSMNSVTDKNPSSFSGISQTAQASGLRVYRTAPKVRVRGEKSREQSLNAHHLRDDIECYLNKLTTPIIGPVRPRPMLLAGISGRR